jgi:hypothetical protein
MKIILYYMHLILYNFIFLAICLVKLYLVWTLTKPRMQGKKGYMEYIRGGSRPLATRATAQGVAAMLRLDNVL